jgi:hypothetical protein
MRRDGERRISSALNRGRRVCESDNQDLVVRLAEDTGAVSMVDQPHADSDQEPPTEAVAEIVGELVGDPDEGAEDADPQRIEEPGKLLRIAAMTRAMLNEVREAPLDEGGRARLSHVYEATVDQLCSVLPDELRGELGAVLVPLSSDSPSEAELRVAQAQLIGWLEGLFNGIQAAVMSQQMAAMAQLQQMRRQPELPEQSSGGLYL